MDPTGTADNGQGTESQGGSIFDPYLQSVPEDARDYVGNYLKDAERNVNSRLAEAADIQKRFGPYSDVDFSAYGPQQLNDLLAWHQSVTASPQTFNEWLSEAAKEAGLIQEQREAEDEFGELTPQQIQALIQQNITQALTPFQQQQAQFQEQQQLAGLERQIIDDFTRIEKAVGPLSDDQKAAIVDLGESHDGPDWLDVGLKRFQALAGQAQASLVNGKAGQPRPGLTSGSQEAPALPKDPKELHAMAVERMRQALNT